MTRPLALLAFAAAWLVVATVTIAAAGPLCMAVPA